MGTFLSSEWYIFCILIPLLIIASAFFFIARKEEKQKKHAWRIFATQNGLAFKFNRLLTTIRVFGEYRGRQLQLTSFRTSGGRTEHLKIRLSLNNQANIHLLIREYKLQDSLTDAFSNQANHSKLVKQQFVAEGQPESFMTNLFKNTDIGQNLMNAYLHNPFKLKIDAQHLIYEQLYTDELAQVEHMLNLLCRLAKAVESF